MAPFFTDTFTEASDTELSLHIPDVGTSWSRVWSDGANPRLSAIGATDTCKCSTTANDSGVGYTANATYPSADYEAQITWVAGSGFSTRPLYILIRYQDTSNMYAVRLANVASGCQLYKKVSGTWTALGSAVTIAVGSVVKLKIVGTALELFDDGASVASATVSDISAAGKMGLAVGGGAVLVTSTDDANGTSEWDSLTITDLGSSAISGTAAITLGGLTLASAAASPIAAAAAITLGGLTAASAGVSPIAASSAITLAGLTAAGGAVSPIAATAAITLGGLTAAGAGAVKVAGATAITLGDLTTAATGTSGGAVFGDVIQAVEDSSLNTGTITINFAPPTVGNLLIFGVGTANQQTWGLIPTGWTQIGQVADGAGNASGSWYYKISDGTETSVTETVSPTAVSMRGVFAEFQGPFAASPLDQVAEDEGNISTVVTSQGTGTTGTTAQANELAIAFIAADTVVNLNGTPTYSNSFTSVILPTTSTGRALALLAKKVLSATGTVTMTYSVTDTGDEAYGAIATFKQAVSVASGTAAITLGGLSASAAAVAPVKGSASITLASATGTGAGVAWASGVFPGATGFTAPLTYGDVISYAGSTAPLQDLTLSAVGTVTPPLVRGDAPILLAGLSLSAAGASVIAVSAAPSLGGLTTAAQVVQTDPPQATAAITLGGLAASAAGAVRAAGAAAITLGGLSASAAAHVTGYGQVAVTLGGLTATGAAEATIVGEAWLTLDDLATSFAAISNNHLAAAIVLGDLAAAALGASSISGQSAGILGDAQLTATGAVTATGLASIALDGLNVSATAGVPAALADGAIVLDGLTLQAVVLPKAAAEVVMVLDGLTANAAVATTTHGSLSVVFDDAAFSATGIAPAKVRATIILGPMETTSEAELHEPIAAVVDIVLDWFTSATGEVLTTGSAAMVLSDLTTGAARTLTPLARTLPIGAELRWFVIPHEDRAVAVPG